MDSHQGAAAFAFDMNMDFSSVFAKPSEHEPLNNFFFADEAIDTTTNFADPLAMFSQQTSFDIQQDICPNTASGSASAWQGSSFDSAYTLPSSCLGKRSLQLEAEDVPQSKRHEPIGDFTLFPTPAATWVSDVQSTPAASSVELGLPDEAADMCAMWFNKYAILPSDRHIDSLSQLTGESADAIRHWFGRLMKQGMNTSQGDSAYRSQTALPPTQFWNEHNTGLVQVPQLPFDESTRESPTMNSDVSPVQENVKGSQASNPLRGGKKSRCIPTDDLSLLSRDPFKIYQCTRKCGKRYGRKCDWKRNEEEGYPCKSWVCNLCKSTGTENVKPSFRKYHFVQHFRNIHPSLNYEDYQEASVVCSETEFPRRCGFCRHRFASRQDRIDHIADHFKKGSCMLDWNESDGDSGSDDANNDDNDDQPSDDDFDSSRPHQPPSRDPRGGSDSQYHNSGGYEDGGSGSGSRAGYFQFQLSRLNEGETGSQVCYAKQTVVKPTREHRTRCRSEPPRQRSSSNDGLGTTAQYDADLLARDAISSTLALSQKDCQKLPLDGLKSTNADIDNEQGRPVDARQQNQVSDLSPVKSKAFQLIPANSHSFLSVRFLGSGGFSTVDEVVHRGTKLRLGRKTLKNRDPAAVEELRKEVNVLQKLRHPHVIRFLGAYSQGDKMSILLSPIADTTLSLWLERFAHVKPTNFSDIITKMFGCLASSVRYLHEQRPVVKHLDIKPQNILIVEGEGEFPHVVLCDFGISTSDDICEGRSQPLTRQYVAPEVFGGFHRTSRTPAADIWSLGCVFAEMASMSFDESNAKWSSFRSEFSGKTGKYYWQDVAGLQNRLGLVLENATSAPERTIARTLQAMLQRQPAERPDASSLTLVFTPAPCCLSWPNDKATYPGPQEELKIVEMLAQEDGNDYRNQVNRCSSIPTAIRQEIQGAQSWLAQCLHSHEACRHSGLYETKTLPTRLVDIKPENGKSCVRIVDSVSIESPPGSVEYVALSHMWNESHKTLNTAGLNTLHSGIPLSTLSCALTTAITAAQDLGYRYVWTDSLCVVQDNEVSRREECVNMASVFRNAALTLVLDSIDNGIEDFRKELAETESGFAWDTRAWALQERLLSHRFLHLGQEQMYWECNSLKASQTFPQGLPLLVWEKAHSKPDMLKCIEPGMNEMPSNNSLLAPDPIAASTEEGLRPISITVTNKKSSSPRTKPLRDLQRVRKEGGGTGDSLAIDQTTLQTDSAVALSALGDKPTAASDNLGNLTVSKTCTCVGGNKRLTVDGGTQKCNSKALLLSNDVDGRRDTRSGGQLDRHGSRNMRSRGEDSNAKGNGTDMDSGDANAKGKE